jgi:threonylcarbamoyladenosine tRNA methylthiotransferase MtaB
LTLKVHLITFGCKANQYDTERIRQELEARGAQVVDDAAQADTFILNTCTVTNEADAEARRAIRRLHRLQPDARVIVAGCSAALRADDYAQLVGAQSVVRGHDPVQVAAALNLSELDEEPIGGQLLARDERGVRGWLKVQDGCDRRCSFCATKLARGPARSRPVAALVEEARALSATHRELVITGVHIGHYGWDRHTRGQPRTDTLAALMVALIEAVPDTRFRLGSVEATELDDQLIALMEEAGGQLVPHLHMPLQSGADPVLRRMRRWHTREQYRRRTLEIASRVPYLGLGADIIAGFPGESDADHAATRALVEELPFTYLHVFPYSPRDNTPAASMPDQVPGDVAAARARELREIAASKGAAYRARRAGQGACVVVERGGWGLTEDYLRVRLTGAPEQAVGALRYVPLVLDEAGELSARV